MSRSEQLKGRALQARGVVKEMAGRVTGNQRLRTEGRFERSGGKTFSRGVGMKDKVRGNLRGKRR